ncbi:nucleoside triphosphate pyrophosphohydrolase [Salinimonas marina]|uniref:Nucleoside triphosphate pyrophosphohydrolase n=1 Tax=Salinimonas marina TaxID=2785918 RepID=A0A7S9DWD7_9ALTE|nr:nucleoside triphosphate pyrophosphohydrolase [Salinimonas marina]QPG05188.1 nucleoside triphosphate pyrophosphohydrolase [Salinimonas marina]
MSNEKPAEHDNLPRLLRVMARLRDPQFGCPWDRQQTMQSLTRFTLEEAYEVVDAIEQNQPREICDELGDLLFQIVFYAQLANEQNWFNFNDIAGSIADKMVRRHPHVFADMQATANDMEQQWEAIKAAEKAGRPAADSILDDVPKGMPALMYAQKLQKRCARVGFDWATPAPVLAKVNEELGEIQAELEQPEPVQARIEEEIGDALFAMVNLARHCNVDADGALRRASLKFARRFGGVEELAREQQAPLADLNLEQLEQLWQTVKAQETATG